MSKLRILFCTSEMAPFIKTGGLGDVAGALPPVLKKQGLEVSCVLPLYGDIQKGKYGIENSGKRFTVVLGNQREHFGIHRCEAGGVPVYFLQSEKLFGRPGLYEGYDSQYKDNCRRFAMFSMACLKLSEILSLRPHLYHVHDWQTALLPVFLHGQTNGGARSLLTIHNLAFQGTFPARQYHWTGLDWDLFNWQSLEFYGKVNFLKGGIVYSDAVSTVSPGYAREIQHPELGCGLDGVLREKAEHLYGIMNGIDKSEWNPETDPYIPARYRKEDLSGKTRCRASLMKEAGILSSGKPLGGMVTRITDQKGLEILIPVLKTLLNEGYSFVLLGTGDRKYERQLSELKRSFPDSFGLFLRFDNRLAHLIEAGSDIFIMPSKFEPCGLNQIYSMRYGTVPVVRATGGLADSVRPFTLDQTQEANRKATGFTFREYSPEALLRTLRQAIAVFGNKQVWSRIMLNGMKSDFGWEKSAGKYTALYERIVERELCPVS